LVQDHKGGNIVQALGTSLGSLFSGLAPLKSQPCNSPLSKEQMDSMYPTIPANNFQFVKQKVTSKDDSDKVLFKEQTTPLSLTLPNSLEGLIEHLANMMRGNNQLYLYVVQSLKRYISELSTMKQSQHENGKEVVTTLDNFVIPKKLTKRQMFGVVDVYRGGRKAKRLFAPMMKKNRCWL
jgi:hypothetical protein